MLSLGLNLLAKINKWRLGEYPLAILYFHRVLPQKDPFLPDDPTAEEFEDLIKTISQYYSTYTISKALELQSLGNLPKLSVCISFDDGYADNYTHALPILQKYGVPGTFYVTSKGTQDGYLWNDILLNHIRNTDVTELNALDSLWPLNSMQNKVATYLALVSKLKFLANSKRDEALELIVNLLGNVPPQTCMMDEEQLKNLQRLGHEIGAHTASHSILGEQTKDVAFSEIQTSKLYLDQVLHSPIDTFAFPNGYFPRDFNQEHIDMVKQLGFKSACSTNDGGIISSSNRYAISRFMPHRKEKNQFCLSIQKIAGEHV